MQTTLVNIEYAKFFWFFTCSTLFLCILAPEWKELVINEKGLLGPKSKWKLDKMPTCHNLSCKKSGSLRSSLEAKLRPFILIWVKLLFIPNKQWQFLMGIKILLEFCHVEKERMCRKTTLFANLLRFLLCSLGAGTKIEFLTDQGETLRNEYLLCKNFKTGYGFFVTRTVFSHQLCPRSL